MTYDPIYGHGQGHGGPKVCLTHGIALPVESVICWECYMWIVLPVDIVTDGEHYLQIALPLSSITGG